MVLGLSSSELNGFRVTRTQSRPLFGDRVDPC